MLSAGRATPASTRRRAAAARRAPRPEPAARAPEAEPAPRAAGRSRRPAPERVAVEPGIVGGDPALLAGDADDDRAALAAQHIEQCGRVDAREHALGRLRAGQIADPAQDVAERVARAGAHAVGAVLE